MNEETQETTEITEKKEDTSTPQESSTTITVNGGKIKTNINFSFLKKEIPKFKAGDTVRIDFKIKEGEKERIQTYEGIVIAMRGEGFSHSFMVRRISYEVGVERIFPLYSPLVEKITVVRRGKVRRARLYYLREKSGKEGRIKEAFAKTKNIPEAKKEKEIENDEVLETKSKKKKVANKAITNKETKKKITKKVASKVAKKTVSKVAKKTISKVSKKSSKKKSTSKKKSKKT